MRRRYRLGKNAHVPSERWSRDEEKKRWAAVDIREEVEQCGALALIGQREQAEEYSYFLLSVCRLLHTEKKTPKKSGQLPADRDAFKQIWNVKDIKKGATEKKTK
jgi:hypothetical protein